MRGLAWKLPNGRLAPVRCGRSNRCAYCAWLTSVENSLVVGIDARHTQPTVGLTLTTHRPDFEMERFRSATAVLFRGLRRRYPHAQYLGLMEWTTGRRTPGRRPHMHALVKGVPREAAAELHPWVRERWAALTDGAWVVECRPLRTPGGAIAYMVGHHHKRDQAPPPSFKGKRIRPSKGYFHRPVAELRDEARTVMRARTVTRTQLAHLVDQDVPEDVINEFLPQLVTDALAAPPPELVRLDDERPREVEAFRRAMKNGVQTPVRNADRKRQATGSARKARKVHPETSRL